MMKLRNSFLKRCLSLVLALVLVVSNVGPGIALRASAAGLTKTAGKLMAENYGLTSEQEKLLGYLNGDNTVEYSAVEDGWVAVDPDAKKITAIEENGWKAVKADIVVDGASVEEVAMVNGVGTYAYAGNAFSVTVSYELMKNVEGQQTMLNGYAALKSAIAKADIVSGQSGNLYILEQAMPELVNFANNGVSTPLGDVSFSAACQAAVNTLNGQMSANGGKLNLSVMAAEFEAGSKSAYVSTKGDDMAAEVVALFNNISTINEAMTTMVENLELFISNGWVSQELANQLQTLAGVCANLEAGLISVNNDWNAEGHVKADANFAELDALLATAGNISVSVKNPLKVAEDTVQFNMSMKNVTVKVVLKVVENKADSAKLEQYDENTDVVTLSDGATAAEIEAAAKAAVEAAKAEWAGVYVDGKFEATATALPDALVEDITYTITYAPKTVAVTGDVEMNVPYGYQLTLPKPEDAGEGRNYQYTIDGTTYYGGDVYTILADTTIDRSEDIKETQGVDLYTVIANNYGNDVAKAILTSGALKGNTTFTIAKPDSKNPQAYVALQDGKLTVASSVSADYKGMSWAPYTYGVNGTEKKFGGETSVAWTEKDVNVQYKLDLTCFGENKAQEVLDLAAQLKTEAAAQKSAMDSLAGMESTLEMLDRTKLGALNGVIDVTDFTPGDGNNDDAQTVEIRKELKEVISNIIANNLEGSVLRIYNMVVAYNANGLKYYYENYNTIKNEVNSLSGYMTELMDNEEALRIMCSAAGYGEYADKISDVEGKLNTYNAMLSAPNAGVNVKSANLGKLITALTAEGSAECTATGYAYLLSENLTAMDNSSVMIQAIIEVGSQTANVNTGALDRGVIVTADMITALKSGVEAKVAELLPAGTKYYKVTTDASLDALVGTELNATVNVKYTYTPKTFTVKIDGEADQKVTIENLEVKLPAHPTAGWKYIYTVAGEEQKEGTDSYTFSAAQLDTLFVDGSYTITRTEINTVVEDFEEVFGDWAVKDENGNIVGLKAEVAGNDIMSFAMTLVDSGYDYIAFNNEAFLYMNEENSLEICMQTLINALLHDNTFSNDTLIALGNNGKGKLLSAKMDLGTAGGGKARAGMTIIHDDLSFELHMTSAPSVMSTVAKGLNAIKPYMTFKANDGVMDVTLDLPEKVYEAYLTALLATGNVDKSDITALNDEIAYEFLWDYVETILDTDANATTFENTLGKLGQSKNLSDYDKYYQLMKKALTNDGVKINEVKNDDFDMSVNAKGQKAINALINMLGIDVSAYETYLGMIKEYSNPDAEINAAARAILKDAGTAFEALVIDVKNSSTLNKIDYTKDLPARAKEIGGEAAVLLLGDVDGDLTFKGTTILDLNGHKVNGSIHGNGTLFIVDSGLVTASGAHVTGSVSGNVTILGGKFDANISSYLKDGYKQNADGVVQNILYTVEGGKARSAAENLIFNLNTDVLAEAGGMSYVNFAKAVAVDVAVDVILNYYTSAALAADDNTLYDVKLDDLIGLLTESNKVDNLIQKALDSVNVPGMSDFTNVILADLLDFAAIRDAAKGDKIFATYKLSTSPWKVNVRHIVDGDYMTFDVISNPALKKDRNISLKLSGGNVKYVEKVAAELADVAQGTGVVVDVKKPVYGNKLFTVEGSAAATIKLDLTKRDAYRNILTIILASGNPSNKAALVAALKAGDMDALKAEFDNLTVKNVFDALKNVNKNDTLQGLANKAGITVNVPSDKWAEMEELFILMVSGAGKVLEELEITGMNSKLGNLDKDGDGTYELSGDVTKGGNVSASGYGVNATATAKVDLSVKLFAEDDCLWGDANHDGKVTGKDASLIARYYAKLDIDEFFCTVRTDVNCDGNITGKDASLVARYYAKLIDELPQPIAD